MIFPYFKVSFAFTFELFQELASNIDRRLGKSLMLKFSRTVYSVLIWLVLVGELKGIIINNINFRYGDFELYNLHRSGALVDYDYDSLKEIHKNETITNLDKVESAYFTNKYDSPLTSMMHSKDFKVSVLS